MKEIIFGSHSIITWWGSMIWIIIAIAFVKLYGYSQRQDNSSWSWKYFIQNNWTDVTLGIIFGVFLLRAGEYGLNLIIQAGYSIPFNIKENSDITVLYAVISGYFQLQLHKKRDKLKLK